MCQINVHARLFGKLEYVVVTSFFSRILLKIGNEKASKASLFDHEIQKITLT